VRDLLASGMLILSMVVAGFAQEGSSTEVAATKEDIETLFTTMHIREQVHKMIDGMMAQMKQITHENVRKHVPNITQKELDRIDAMTDTTMKSYNLDDIFNDMIPIYQRHLTKADITAMLAFYESPTGRKLLREQPAMIAESMEISRTRMEKVMGELMDKIEDMATRDAQGGTEGSPRH
jgi:hypothetical protein